MVDAQVARRSETAAERQEAGAVAALAMLHELNVDRDGAGRDGMPLVGRVGMDHRFESAPNGPDA